MLSVDEPEPGAARPEARVGGEVEDPRCGRLPQPAGRGRAARVHRTAERRADVFTPADPGASLRDRVAAIIDTLYDGLAEPDSRAIENLRAALPRDPAA